MLLPTALAFVSYGFVLVQVQVHIGISLMSTNLVLGVDDIFPLLVLDVAMTSIV